MWPWKGDKSKEELDPMSSNQVAPEPLPGPSTNAQSADAKHEHTHKGHRKKSKRHSKDDNEQGPPPPVPTQEERVKEKASKLTIADALRIFEAHKKWAKKKLEDPNAKEKRQPRMSLGNASQTSALTLFNERNTASICPEELERRERDERSDSRRNAMKGVVPSKPTPGISGYILDNFIESTIPDCPAGMEAILDLDHVFIQQASKEAFLQLFPEPLRKMLEIKSIDSKRLYIGGETLEDYHSYPSKSLELDFTFTGPSGGLVFYVYGNNKMLKVGNEDYRFGKIIRLGYSEKPNSFYKILNDKDIPIFELVPSINHSTKELEYKVLCLEKSSHGVIGIIKLRLGNELSTSVDAPGPEAEKTNDRKTSNPDAEGLFSQGPVFSINFPKDLNPNHKTLLIGALIFLNHKRTVPISYGPNKGRFRFGVLYILLVCLICLTCILIIIILVATSDSGNKKDTGIPECDPKNDTNTS